MLPPFVRDARCPGVRDDYAADHRAEGVHVAERAGCLPDGFLIIPRIFAGAPQRERYSVLYRCAAAVAECFRRRLRGCRR